MAPSHLLSALLTPSEIELPKKTLRQIWHHQFLKFENSKFPLKDEGNCDVGGEKEFAVLKHRLDRTEQSLDNLGKCIS